MRAVHMSSFSKYKTCAVNWSTQSPCTAGIIWALYAPIRNPVIRKIFVMMNTTKYQWLLAAMQVLRNKQWWSVWWWQATQRRQWWDKGGDASWQSEQYPFTMPSPTPLSTSWRGPSGRTMPGSPTKIQMLKINYQRMHHKTDIEIAFIMEICYIAINAGNNSFDPQMMVCITLIGRASMNISAHYLKQIYSGLHNTD